MKRNPITSAISSIKRKTQRRFFRSKRRVVRYGLVIVNIAFFIGVSSFVVLSQSTATSDRSSQRSTSLEEEVSDPLDTLSSADIAVNIAQLVQLDETTAVINNADSQGESLDIVPADTQIVAKPQIVATGTKTLDDVVTYVVVDGDTVSDIADKFNVSANSVRWSNGLTGDWVEVGKKLTIPPIDGFVYKVKEGDTIKSLASRFSTSEAKITAFNDIELTGLVANKNIVIPDGAKQVQRAAPVRSFRAATYGYNGYDYGYCTYHVANQVSVPVNWGNAKWWDDNAARTPGWGVIYSPGPGEVPAGAILVANGGYYGHVAYVERVNPDGSLFISEMNANWQWNVLSTRTVSKEEIGRYNYVVRY